MPEPNFPNRTLALMDNLRFLLSMDDACIDLIAIDPPFGKMETFRSEARPPITAREKGEEIGLFLEHYPDKTEADFPELETGTKVDDLWNWERDIEKNASHARFMRELRAEARAYDAAVDSGDKMPDPSLAVRLYRVIDVTMAAAGQGMAAYICFMAVRLVECHRVLKDTGSIYVHCDWKANSHLRLLLDTIFGSENFRNQIAWCYTGPSAAKNWYPRKYDTILFFAKSPKHRFDGDAVRLPYVADFTPARGVHGANRGTASEGRHQKGKIPTDWWNDGHISNISGWRNELTGYSTQKPLALYERIIAASSNPGDVVLDVFAGCATTAVAAERLNRRWIACDHAYRSWTMIKRRFYKNGYAMDGMTEATPAAYGEHQTGWADDLEIKPSRVVGPAEMTPREQLLPELEVATGGVRRATVWNGSIPKQECKNLLLAEFGCVCWGCGKRPVLPNGAEDPDELEIDHLFARNPADGDEGGADDLYNLGLVCSKCNGRKSNKLRMVQLRDDREAEGLLWVKQDQLVHLERARKWAVNMMMRRQARRGELA